MRTRKLSTNYSYMHLKRTNNATTTSTSNATASTATIVAQLKYRMHHHILHTYLHGKHAKGFEVSGQVGRLHRLQPGSHH